MYWPDQRSPLSGSFSRSGLSRRAFLLTGAAAGAAVGLAAAPAQATTGRRPFGPYGSLAARLSPQTLYVDPQGRGDYTSVQAAVSATTGSGWIIVLARGTYRETVTVDASRTEMTWIGATGNARDVVVVFDNAAGTQKPDGSGTYGTSGSATTTLRADGFTARRITFANDWLRADHPGVSGTQAVAIKVMGDRSAFYHCRFLGHQDTLYADSTALTAFARQYFSHCYVKGDVDFVFGRATAVFGHCRFHSLNRTDLSGGPYGFVFAPSTARSNPHGYLVVRCRITSEAPDGYYKLARPWVPSSDPTAWPSLTVRETWIGPGIDAAAPYADMRDDYPWQEQRFAEYRNRGPGAAIVIPQNRPQLTPQEEGEYAPGTYLGDWRP
jgi:pectinesterase